MNGTMRRMMRGVCILGGLTAWTALVGFALSWGLWLGLTGRTKVDWTAETALIIAGFLLLTAGAWVVGVRRIRRCAGPARMTRRWGRWWRRC